MLPERSIVYGGGELLYLSGEKAVYAGFPDQKRIFDALPFTFYEIRDVNVFQAGVRGGLEGEAGEVGWPCDSYGPSRPTP
jgi:hypothetical protein